MAYLAMIDVMCRWDCKEVMSEGRDPGFKPRTPHVLEKNTVLMSNDGRLGVDAYWNVKIFFILVLQLKSLKWLKLIYVGGCLRWPPTQMYLSWRSCTPAQILICASTDCYDGCSNCQHKSILTIATNIFFSSVYIVRRT